MTKRPTETELVRYLEGDLSGRSARLVESRIAEDPGLAEIVEKMRRGLTIQAELRSAAKESPSLATERRIELGLINSVTSTLTGTKMKDPFSTPHSN